MHLWELYSRSDVTLVENVYTKCHAWHTHPFNGPFSGIIRVGRYQKGKNQSGFYWSKRQWVAVASAGPYASLHLAPDRQPRQHPTTQFFAGRMPFLLPNQQRQSTEGHRENGIKYAICTVQEQHQSHLAAVQSVALCRVTKWTRQFHADVTPLPPQSSAFHAPRMLLSCLSRPAETRLEASRTLPDNTHHDVLSRT